MKGFLAVLLALVIGGLTAAACGPSQTASTPPSPTAPSAAASSPPALASPVFRPSPTPTSVAAAEKMVRSTVTGARPLLMPTTIPSTWSATVTELGSWFFEVTYSNPDQTRSITFAIQVPNPPPPGPNGSQAYPRFHGDVHSMYQVDDQTLATSRRWLMWNEPGTWTEPNGLPGVPYFLRATGMTDTDFWAVANAIR